MKVGYIVRDVNLLSRIKPAASRAETCVIARETIRIGTKKNIVFHRCTAKEDPTNNDWLDYWQDGRAIHHEVPQPGASSQPTMSS